MVVSQLRDLGLPNREEGMISKKTALKRCIELWDWLADNLDKEKYNWPGWEKYGKADLECWTCQYTLERNLPCEQCLLAELWPYKRSCMDKRSLYRRWADYGLSSRIRQNAARKIADHCRKLLE